MKKVSLLILVSLILLMAFASCDMLPPLFGEEPEPEHVHDWMEATCEAPKTCACGATEGEKLPHTWTEATCSSPKVCTFCNATEGAALNHNWVSADCETPATCTLCGTTSGEAQGHLWISASCDSAKHCANCNTEEGEPLEHVWVEATCLTPKTCTLCKATEGPALGHTNETVAGFAATCTENGLTDGTVCTVCGETTLAQQIIPALGHTASDWIVDSDPNCTESGFKHQECTVCGVVTNTKSDKPLGHTEGEWIVDLDPTCEEKGKQHKECTVCGETVKTALIPVEGHVEAAAVIENNVAPDCENAGSYDEVVYCATCGDELARNNVTVEALGHDMAPATCQVPSTCSVCGHIEGTVVDHMAGEVQKENEVAPLCEANGSYDLATYCVWCKVELSRETVTVDALGHDMAPATCQAPATCKNGCGKTEGQPLDQHTITVKSMSEELLYYTCASCDAYYVADKALVYDGTKLPQLAKNGDPTIKVNANGEYEVFAGTQKSQYMLYFPSNSNGDKTMFTDFTGAKNSVGVLSFKVKANTLTENLRVIVMTARNNPNWDANGGWNGCSMDVMSMAPNADGTWSVNGKNITNDTFATVSADEWVDVKMFMQLTSDGMFNISYYVNGEFCNVYSRDLLNAGSNQTIKDLSIQCVYICGWTEAGTGFYFDDLAFGYANDAEWAFDSHKHSFVDATCTAPKTCTACGLTEGEALGHDLVAHEAQDPTCTEKGWKAYETCTRCDHSTYTELPATGHNYGSATCDQAATCSVCGFSSGAALGHEFVDYKYNNDAKCELDGTKTAKCIRCDATDTKTAEGTALEHQWASANCSTPSTCTLCGKTGGEPDKTLHDKLTDTHVNGVTTFSCASCGYSFKVDKGEYLDGSSYTGITCNAATNNNVYTTNGSNYPVMVNGHYEFIRTDVEAGAQKQVQVWLPTASGANKFAGFTSANYAVGFLSFKLDVYTDFNFEMKLVDASLPNDYDVNGDGVLEYIRWTEFWGISSPVFSVGVPQNGKVALVGFGKHLASVDVNEDNFTGWLDVDMKITLNPETDTIDVEYFLGGQYIASASHALTTVSNAITGVYINSNNKAAGTGYRFDDLVFGYTAHVHDFESTISNGVLTYTCACGGQYRVEEFCDWDGEGTDTAFKNVSNGNVVVSVNDKGQYEYIFKPETDVAPDFSAAGSQTGNGWAEYTDKGYAGAQLQFWMPSNNRGEGTFEDFSCENNAVGILSFKAKSSLTRLPEWDTALTFSVGKPRNASDWSDGGSWTDDSINIFTIEESAAAGASIKGGLNGTNINFGTIPVGEDGWTEWFDVMIAIELTDTGYMNVYYYINGAFAGSDSRDLNNPGGNRTLNPKKIEALQLSGWTYAPNTGIMFDDFYFGYTVEGHNTLDGQFHKLTEGATCADKTTCSCGWEGYTKAHDFTEATCGAPATCKGCGMTKGENLTHNSLVAVPVDGNVQYTCKDCNKYYTLDGGMHDMGDVSDATTAGLYNKTYDGKTLTMLNNGSDANAQHQFWIPGQTVSPDLAGFTCANNATGFLSFTINSKDDHNTGIEFKVNANRGTGNWGGPSNNGWSESSVGVFKIFPHKDTDTTVKISGYNGATLGNWTMTGTDGWTGEMNVVIKIQLYANNTVSLDYYINGEFFANVKADMVIWTYDISSLYVNGRTNSEGDGYILSNLYFGYTVSGLHDAPVVEPPLYTEVIDAANVQSETLKTIVASKIKQCDQAKPSGNADDLFLEGGTPVYVLADKNGETVEALYFSRSVAWTGKETKQLFTEFRFDVDGSKKATSISFDYKIKGTVEKNDRFTFTGLAGEKFSADAYVQIKTPANHPLAGDNYPELSGTDLVLDGQWHTMTYTFAEPLEIINVLVNLYKFQGELLIANFNVEFEEVKAPFYTEEIAKESVSSSVLQTVVTNKIKQWDQSSAHNSHEGTPVFVKADMNGTEVTGVYFSKTTPWVGDEGEQFSEFRVNVDSSKPATGFSFVYKVEGTVDENKGSGNGGYTFKDLEGNAFVADAYVQIKTPADHPLAGDNYPELSGTDFIIDGQWHTMSYTFPEALAITNMLFNFYHFQGQLIIAELEVTFVEECQHTNTSTNKVDATCTAAGSVKVTCNDCGATVSEETLPATNHANQTTTTVDPTCTEAGSVKITCNDCGETVSEGTIPANGHNLALTYANSVATYACVCGLEFSVDTNVYYDGTNQGFYYTKNGNMLLAPVDGKFEAIFAPAVSTAPEAAGDGWANNSNNNKLGAQHMWWIPSSSAGKGLAGFTCESNAVGIVSFKMQTNVDDAFAISLAKARNDTDWTGWGTSETKVLTVGGYSESGVQLKDAKGQLIATIPVADGWSEWFDVKLVIALHDDNTYDLFYYINDALVASYEALAMNIDTNDFRAVYINGWTYTPGTGVKMDDVVFGYTAGGHNTFDGKAHNLTSEATCQAGAVCSCGWVGAPVDHVLAYRTEGEGVVCYCTTEGCDAGYSVAKGYYNDGTNNANIGFLAANQTAGYTTNANGSPVVVDGYQVFAREAGRTDKGQVQFHVRTAAWADADKYFPNFNAASAATGVIAFKINPNLDSTGNLRFIITNRVESGFGWSGTHSIDILTFSPATADGKINVTGWGGNALVTLQKGEDGYTGWIDVKITIELSVNAKGENIGLVKYYIDGEHVGTTHSSMKVVDGKFNNLYVTANSTEAGTGFMMDDLLFGYTAHEHVYTEKVTQPSCTEAGFTTFTCDCGESYTGNEVAALGHTEGEAVVENKVNASCVVDGKQDNVTYCTVCEAEMSRETVVLTAPGHDFDAANCTSPKTCAVCDATEGEALGHADEDGNYKCDRCSTQMLPADGEALTIPQALAIAELAGTSYTTQKYYITGIVTGLYNTQYGNFYIKDAEGNQICIYGLYSADGSTRYDAMSYKPVNGDEVTVYTVLGMYNTTKQGKNAWLDEVVQHEHDYTESVTDPTCVASGVVTYTCFGCGDSYMTEGEAALGHTTDNGECERCHQTIGGETPVAQYVKVTSANEFTTGTYVLIVNSKNVTLSTVSGTWVKGSALTAGDVIEKSVGDSYAITLEVTDAGVKIKVGNTYIKPKSGNNNGIETGDYTWSYQFQDNGTVVFKGVGSDTTTLAYNVQSSGFRAYKNTTVSGNASGYPSFFTVYKLVG